MRRAICKACCAPPLTQNVWIASQRLLPRRGTSVAHGVCGSSGTQVSTTTGYGHSNPAHGACLRPEEFAIAVRLRIGAPFLGEHIVCPRCAGDLDPGCVHALCCAQGASTKGYNNVRDALLQLASLSDPRATAEPTGLIPSRPMLRPADVLTSAAFPGSLAALDVGVMSPDAAGAGDDACAAMQDRKVKDHAAYREEMARNGVVYCPMAFSCYGRVHPEAAAVMTTLARTAARRRGLADYKPLLRRAHANIAVQLWRRAAAMVRACFPELPVEEQRLLLGADPAECDHDADIMKATCGMVARGPAAHRVA